MVVTQVCDLLHHDIIKEPVAEVLLIKLVGGDPDGNFVNCRSTRDLHLPVTSTDESKKHIRARRIDVRPIPRALLQELVPDPAVMLSPKALMILQRWLALRYQRAALPDTFEERATPAKPQIRHALRQVPHEIDALYIALSSHDELQGGSSYEIALVGVMRVENFIDDSKKTRATKALESLAAAFGKCEGIEVAEYSIESAGTITLDDIEDLVLWNADDLSLGAEPQEAPPDHPV